MSTVCQGWQAVPIQDTQILVRRYDWWAPYVTTEDSDDVFNPVVSEPCRELQGQTLIRAKRNASDWVTFVDIVHTRIDRL